MSFDINHSSNDTPRLHLAVPGKSSVVSSLGYTNYLNNETLLKLRAMYDYILIDVPPFEFVSEQIALIEHADALIISTRMNICSKNELMSLLSQLRSYREKIGGIIATACTKKNTSFKTSKYGNYYDSYHKRSGAHSFVASNKVATSMYKREIRNRRKHVRLRDENYA